MKFVEIVNHLTYLIMKNDITHYDPHYLQQIYEDEKIKIASLIKPHDKLYSQISVEIKIEPEDKSFSSEIRKSMGFGKSEDSVVLSTTPVFCALLKEDGDGYSQTWYRPGRWETYIEFLVEVKSKETRKLQKYDRKPVDDSALFPDIE